MRRRSPLVLALALALSGCGGRDDESEVRAAVASFERAVASRDVQALCDDLLADRLRASLQAVGLPCEVALREALADLRRPRLSVIAVEVDDDRATVRVRSRATGQRPSTDSLRLVREDGGWRIADLAG